MGLMPRLDQYHDTVKRALVKEGWQIASDQFFVKLPERRLWIDLLVRSGDRQILVEVKSYTNIKSPVESLAASVGKCIIYRAALVRINQNFPLYLAIPTVAFQGIFAPSTGWLNCL
jgi:Holliday junction resolvase-like predicted endonuclease